MIVRFNSSSFYFIPQFYFFFKEEFINLLNAPAVLSAAGQADSRSEEGLNRNYFGIEITRSEQDAINRVNHFVYFIVLYFYDFQFFILLFINSISFLFQVKGCKIF